jgi:hypothetical protein
MTLKLLTIIGFLSPGFFAYQLRSPSAYHSFANVNKGKQEQNLIDQTLLANGESIACSSYHPSISYLETWSDKIKYQPNKKYYGYSFDDYTAPSTGQATKAALNITNSKVKIYDKQTVIADYKKGKINFGGHYQLYDMEIVEYAKGNDVLGSSYELKTILIDTRTGIAYPTPIAGLTPVYCDSGYSKKNFENTAYLYKRNSNLLIAHECTVDSNFDEVVLIKIYEWTGTKFQLIGTKKGRKKSGID